MRAHHGHPHAGAADQHLGEVQDLPALVLHLHLLAGVAEILLGPDLRDHVVGDGVGKGPGLVRLALELRLDLLGKLPHARHARAADGLVGGGYHGLDGAGLSEGRHGHQRDDGGAVGVRDDAFMPFRVLGVDLRHDQGHVLLQPEGAGIVHEHGPRVQDVRCEPHGDVVLRRAQNQVEALERVFLRLGDGHRLPLIQDGLAGAPGAGQGPEALHGEVPLRQNLQHLLAHRAGGSQDAYVHSLHGLFLPFGLDFVYYRTPAPKSQGPNANEA